MSTIPEYIIKAYSQSTNTTQREINLMNAHPNNEREAMKWANAFAMKCNERKTLGATDWVGQIELVNTNSFARTN